MKNSVILTEQQREMSRWKKKKKTEILLILN